MVHVYNKIQTNQYVVVATWDCKVYMGLLLANTSNYIVLKNIEVHELGDTTKTYMIPRIVIDKADIELLTPVKYIPIEERIK